MGIIASTLLPILTFDTTPFWSVYYRYIDPWVSEIRLPRRIATIDWSSCVEWVKSIPFMSIPKHLWKLFKTALSTSQSLLHLLLYPILIGFPIIVCYYAWLDFKSPNNQQTITREIEAVQLHDTLHRAHFFSHPFSSFVDKMIASI